LRKRYIVGGGLLVLAIAALISVSLSNSLSYYLTVSELVDRESEFFDTSLRVIGKVSDDGIEWSPDTLELRFTITEGACSLPVIYEGAKPSGFQVSSDILAEGKHHSDGVFRASTLIMKCPSKYEPEE